MGIIEEHVPYFFQDLHAKVTTDLGGVRRLSVSGYLNSEWLNDVDARHQWTREMVMAWGNAAFSVHYRDRLGANGIIDANLGHSRFTSDLTRLHQEHAAVDNEGVEHETPPDTILFGDGLMSETRAGLRATWHMGRATIIAGTQATRFEGDHEYHVTNRYFSDRDISAFVSFSLRESLWRLAAYSNVEFPLRLGFSTRAGLRVDRFQGLATTLAPFAQAELCGLLVGRTHLGVPFAPGRWPPCATRRRSLRASSPTTSSSPSAWHRFPATPSSRSAGRVRGVGFGSGWTHTRARWTV